MIECPICSQENGHHRGCSRWTPDVEARRLGPCTVWIVGGGIERALMRDESGGVWRARWGSGGGYGIVPPYNHTSKEDSAG
jgi:hypothetical protein